LAWKSEKIGGRSDEQASNQKISSSRFFFAKQLHGGLHQRQQQRDCGHRVIINNNTTISANNSRHWASSFSIKIKWWRRINSAEKAAAQISYCQSGRSLFVR
jgi:hypothetical protein